MPVEVVGNLLWGRYLSVVKCDGFVLIPWWWFSIYCLDSSLQFGRVGLVVQRLHVCLLCSFVVLVSSSFICCRACEVGSLGLRSSRALIFSIIYAGTGSVLRRCRPDVHNQGLRLCLGAFRTSPVQSLYVEANEPPLDMMRTRLSLQYGVKLMSNEVNPAYSAVFQSDIVATYEAKERAIKPLGLRIERHLDRVGFHTQTSP